VALIESGERIEGDLLVGADGISSVIRSQLHGTTEPRYAGYTCWRGICPGDGILPAGEALLMAGSGSQFGIWPCGAGRYYWFLTRNAPQGTRQGKSDAINVCRKWATPAPEIVANTPEEAVLQNDILDRPPLSRWSRGAVTLLGDAAHATTPNFGQGACQALEDVIVLADSLRCTTPVEAALQIYEQRRIPRTTMVVRASRQAGQMLQLNNPALESARNWFLGSAMGRRVALRSFGELLLYRVPSLNDAKGTDSPES
jgi:2-polyprenyl-6-methoxyphenol hydroxylase-like FAD-dependent oxidoreductase